MRARMLIVAGALLLASACGDAPREAFSLRVEYAGCRTLATAPRCAPAADGRMTLWVQAPPDAEIDVDASALRAPAPPPDAVQSGHRYTLDVAPHAQALMVRARTASAERTWRLELAATAADPLAAARADFEAGALEGARARLEDELRTGSEETRGAALGLLARVALRGGRHDEAQAHLRAAMAAHAAHARNPALVNDATMLVFLLLQQRQFAEARSVLEALAPGAEDPAESRYLVDYYRGLLARFTGDARNALRGFESAVAQAERVALVAWGRDAQDQLATQLQALGRRAEADATFAKLVADAPADLADCARGQLLTNAGWNRLLALEADEPADDPTPMLDTALALYERGCSPERERLVNARLNLALAALHAGRAGDARAQLEAAAPLRAQASPSLLLWWRDLEGRVALAERRPAEALAVYAALEAQAGASAAPDVQWRAAFGQAQAHVALGAAEAALEAFARADRLLDEESLQVPMQEGRETFAARRERATREHVALLLDAGRAGEALDVVRSARSRALRALYRQDRLAQLAGAERARWDGAIAEYLAQRDALNVAAAEDWRRSAAELRALDAERTATRAALAHALDDAFLVLDRAERGAQRLREPAPGELMLAYHPLPAGWVAFAHTTAGSRAMTLGCVDAAEGATALASCLLEPFREEIAGARLIRVLPYGVLRSIDFHALPFGGDILLAAAPVVYGLDLPAMPDAALHTDRALVVADPRGNLPAARHEAELVRAALEAGREWAPEMLAGEAARASALRKRLVDVELFHYAGHAVFGGASGWESVLPLAESSDLTLGDILALARAPRWVVLSGCETARAGAAAPAESLGLAQAFLAAGSASVLAAVRPVADETAAALVERFYRTWSGATPASAALRSAQLALRAQDPRADWASFRIVEH